jgi:hypothetical protein
VRDQNGRAEWVDVRKGATDGDLIEVLGDLKAGDVVVRITTDEIREGSSIRSRATELAVASGGSREATVITS